MGGEGGRQKSGRQHGVAEVKLRRKKYLALAKWAGMVNKDCAEQKPWGKEGVRWTVFNEVPGGERWRLPRQCCGLRVHLRQHSQ